MEISRYLPEARVLLKEKFPNKTTTLIVARHAQSEANIENQGHILNPDLTPTGKKQAFSLGEVLKEKNLYPDAIITSGRPRSDQTAIEVINSLNTESIQFATDTRLREKKQGIDVEIFKGRTSALNTELQNILSNLPVGTRLDYVPSARWVDKNYFETDREAAGRFTEALEDITALYSGKTVLVITHKLIMNAFLAKQEHTLSNPGQILPETNIFNTGYFILEEQQKKEKNSPVFKITEKNLKGVAGENNY